MVGEVGDVNRTDRLLAIIWLLRTRTKIKAEELAAIFGVTPRSIYRDVQALVEANVPVISLPGPDGGYSLMKEYSVTPITFSDDEVAALFVGAGMLQAMRLGHFAKAVRSAMDKITRVLPTGQEERLRTLQRAIHPELGGRALDETEMRLHQLLEQAIVNGTVLHAVYRGTDGDSTERDIEPYGLVYQTGWWYAVAYCQMRQGMRMFRLDRFQQLQPTDRKFRRPADFSLEPYLFRTGDELELRGPRAPVCLGGTPGQLNYVEAHPYFSRCDPVRNGALMQLEVPRSAFWQLVRLSLESAGRLEVLEPPELREQVLAAARLIVSRHEQNVSEPMTHRPGG